MNETKYVIEYKKNLNQEEWISFMMLYAPILSPLAAQLYLLLMALMANHTKIRNNRFLCESLHCAPHELSGARVELEQFLLCKTYENKEKNTLMLVLDNPKCGNDFLSHEVLGRYYLKMMGSKMHQFVTVSFAQFDVSKEGFQDISASMKAQCLADWNEKEELQYQKYVEAQPPKNSHFDMDAFLANCTELVFPSVARNKENIDLIAYLGSEYNVSMKDMNEYVGKSVDLKTKKIKANVLRKKVLDAYVPKIQEEKNPYEYSCYDFLYKKQNNIKPSHADVKILEDLQHVYKLSSSVINVLIEYVLNTNNQKLDRAYIEKMAALWVRRNVDSIEKALQECSAPMNVKKERKTTQRKIPEWYHEKENENKTNQASELEIEAVNELLKNLG